MATKEFSLDPVDVAPVKTQYRNIQTAIPVPESVPRLKEMRALEPRSMGGQPPVIWHTGDHCTVSDAYGNTWLDFSSGVLVTNSGHGRKEIADAICETARQSLYHAYCFPTDERLQLVEAIREVLPAPLSKVFLVTTGSEATECCIKIARTKAMRHHGPKKAVLVTFEHAFHGRTLAAQLAGGIPGLKSWIGELDPRFVQVPFPDGFRQEDISFDVFEKALADQGVNPDDVCGVMTETFQGCNATLMPKPYTQALRKWCNDHDALLICDEVQAAFGRTGKWFGFQHLDVVPDLVACGKGISGGMPLSAVLGTQELMDLYGPGEMTSTHSANPVCSAAALANITLIKNEHLVENAAKLDPILQEGLASIASAVDGRIGRHDSVGLVGALQWVEPGTTTPDPHAAWHMIQQAFQRGLMLFAPVGVGGGAVKICPPLCIPEDALREGLDVLHTVAQEMAAQPALS
jgi:4-aminobutyrate aminotransferase-like enzyme